MTAELVLLIFFARICANVHFLEMQPGMRTDGSLTLHGERQHGQDVRASNVTAVVAIANILKSSLGPQGLDKMLVDDIGDVLVTNDGATILQKLEVQHPAAKVLQELSRLQDSEVGDGTTSVVLVAAELLRRANELVKGGIHPTSIIQGYRVAMKEAVKRKLCQEWMFTERNRTLKDFTDVFGESERTCGCHKERLGAAC